MLGGCRKQPSPHASSVASPPSIEAIAAAQKDLITTEQLLARAASRPARSRSASARGRAVPPAPWRLLARPGAPLARGPVAGGGPRGGSRAPFWATVRSQSCTGSCRIRPPLIAVVSTRRRRIDGVQVHTVRTSTRAMSQPSAGIPVTTIHRMFVDLADEHDPTRTRERHPRARLPRPLRRTRGPRLHGPPQRPPQLRSRRTSDRAVQARQRRHQEPRRARLRPQSRRAPRVPHQRPRRGHRGRLPLARPAARRRDRRPAPRPPLHPPRGPAQGARSCNSAGYEVLRFKDTDPPERIVAAVSARRPRPSSSCASRPA